MRPVEKLFAEQFVRGVIARNPAEPEFHQAVQEVVESLVPVLERHTKYLDHRILERIVEPERVILFRVPWMDDRGEVLNGATVSHDFFAVLGVEPVIGRAFAPDEDVPGGPAVAMAVGT